MKKILFVGGSFDDIGGRESSYIKKFTNVLKEVIDSDWTIINGGKFSYLQTLIEKTIQNYDAVFWFSDIPNDKPKLVKFIKEKNPTAMLVISKNNKSKKYTKLMLVARALQAKANLLVEFGSDDAGVINGSIIDPLGNVFVEKEKNIDVLVKTLSNRLIELESFTRMSSKKVGETIDCPIVEDFFDIAKEYADKFHEIIHAVNQDRFLGNVSFRCENGFPSIKHKGKIFVSKRNIDKREINNLSFVAVNQSDSEFIEYFGDNKPSVDTPIQKKLYNYYNNINYMLHAHVYIMEAPITESIIPCGALEEFDEIIKLFPNKSLNKVLINLKGHGCLIMVKDVNDLKNIKFTSKL